jgi:hypothetical protein
VDAGAFAAGDPARCGDRALRAGIRDLGAGDGRLSRTGHVLGRDVDGEQGHWRQLRCGCLRLSADRRALRRRSVRFLNVSRLFDNHRAGLRFSGCLSAA